MKKYLPVILLAAAVGFYFWRKAGAAKNLKVYFAGLNLAKGSGLIPNIFAVFRLVNPTNSSLQITSIAGDIFLNGKLVAGFSQVEKFEILPNSESAYKIKITPSGFTVALSVIDLIKSKGKNLTASFNGTINADGINLPINQTVKVLPA